jgi:hypothetical protein
MGAVAAGCLAAAVGYGVWHARQTGRPVLVAANREAQVAPAPPAPPPSPVAEPARAMGDVERHPNAAAPFAAPVKVAPLTRAHGSPAAPSEPASAPVAATIEERDKGVAVKVDQAAASGLALARMASQPAPPPAPRQFAAVLSAPKPAQIKKEEKEVPSTATKQAVVSGTAFGGGAGQPGLPPAPPEQVAAQSAPAPAGLAQDRKGAAAEANQVAINGSVSQGVYGQAPSNRADESRAQVPSSSESVTVTADSVQLETQAQTQAQTINGRQVADLPMAQQRQTLEMAATGTPEVKWSALRRGPDGRLSPVEPDRIRAGDAIVLRLESYADGTLSVAESAPGSAAPRVLMADTRVKRAQPVDTPVVTLDHPGVQELLVRFTARAALKSSAAAAGAKRQSAAPPAQTIVLRYR